MLTWCTCTIWIIIDAIMQHHSQGLSLPRESTPVTAGHVSARFKQISEKWLKEGVGQLKFVSALILCPVGR